MAVENTAALQGRLGVVEKEQQKQLHKHEEKFKALENDLEMIKQKIVQAPNVAMSKPDLNSVPHDGWSGGNDPWANFLRRKGNDKQGFGGGGGRGLPDDDQGHARPRGAGRDGLRGGDEELSDLEKHTLVIGGWNQDTRRGTIEEEAAHLLKLEGIKDFLDCEKITVFGPRKSFGVIRFVQREGENYTLVRERMWAVVKFIAALKYKWPSTGSGGKPAWASLMKTKGARLRTSHASMLRRITLQLAGENKDAEGAPLRPNCLLTENYDIDWNAGTTWYGAAKLGSATHRQPRDGDIKIMPSGWVDIRAIAEITEADVASVIATLERELQ